MESAPRVSFTLFSQLFNSSNGESEHTDGGEPVGMIVITSDQRLHDLFSQFSAKQGPKPASKASIEAMPKVVISEEDKDKECAVCLMDWEVGGEAREMPCKHKYHGECIEKWLKVHGTCPVCRYVMPVDEEEEGGKASDGGNSGEGRTRIWVSFATISGRRDSTSSETRENN